MKRRLFLRWLLINTLAVFLFVALAAAFVEKVSGAPLVVASATLALAAGMSIYAGLLSWQADAALERRRHVAPGSADVAGRLIHKAKHVGFAERTCQILGLVGAGVGFYIISQSGDAASASAAAKDIVDGLGQGLLATMTGVLASLVLALEAHLLVHALETE